MRWRAGLAAVAAAAFAVGCGSGASHRHASAADDLRVVERRDAPNSFEPQPPSHAPVVVRMTRVQGDDPLPFAVDLHADRIAAVRYGGGHGGFEDKRIRLTAAQQARIRRALHDAPWNRLDGHAVTPGGFGGDDNGNRYALFYGRYSTTLAEGHIPPRMARLVKLLNAVIDGDMGRLTYAARHSPIPVTPTPPG